MVVERDGLHQGGISSLASLHGLLCDSGPGAGTGAATYPLHLVPRHSQVRYIYPAAPPAARRSAVTAYPGLRTARRRTARWLMSQALRRPGLDHLVARDVQWEAAPGSLLSTLRHTLGEDLQFSVRVPGRPGKGTAVLTVLAHDGSIRAFVKIAFDAAGREALEREAEGLRVAQRLPAFLAAPRLLAQTLLGSGQLLVIAPLPLGAHRGAPRAPSWRVIEAVSRLGRPGLTAADYLEPLERRLGTALISRRGWRSLHYAASGLPVGRWHGDLTPWNIAIDGERMWVWDWEHSTACAPVGFDLVHYYYQVARLRLHLGERAALRSRRLSYPALRAAGLLDVAPLLLRLHEWELQAQRLERQMRQDVGVRGQG